MYAARETDGVSGIDRVGGDRGSVCKGISAAILTFWLRLCRISQNVLDVALATPPRFLLILLVSLKNSKFRFDLPLHTDPLQRGCHVAQRIRIPRGSDPPGDGVGCPLHRRGKREAISTGAEAFLRNVTRVHRGSCRVRRSRACVCDYAIRESCVVQGALRKDQSDVVGYDEVIASSSF